MLTVPTDRLVAIQGLVNIFASAIGKYRYCFGLFTGDLHRSLLWHRGMLRYTLMIFSSPTVMEYPLSALAETKRFDGVYAPSWSWASIIGPVQYDWADVEYPFHERVVSTLDADLVELNGSLLVAGTIVEGSCRLLPSEDGDDHAPYFHHQGAAESANALVCVFDFDDNADLEHCHCLAISSWKAVFLSKALGPGMVTFYLILARAEDDCGASGSGSSGWRSWPRFRRLGMGADFSERVDTTMASANRQKLVIV